jgi:CRP-like cAMP-binding protein
MTPAERLDVFRASVEFGGRSDAELRRLLVHVDEVLVRQGELLAERGALCHEFILVAEGRVEMRLGGHTVCLDRGDSFGWNAMNERGINRTDLVAATDARVLVMGHAQFRAAEPPPPKRRFHFWALPSSRRSLPRRAYLGRA